MTSTKIPAAGLRPFLGILVILKEGTKMNARRVFAFRRKREVSFFFMSMAEMMREDSDWLTQCLRTKHAVTLIGRVRSVSK